jgi:hypothetical protein
MPAFAAVKRMPNEHETHSLRGSVLAEMEKTT